MCVFYLSFWVPFFSTCNHPNLYFHVVFPGIAPAFPSYYTLMDIILSRCPHNDSN